MNQSISPAIEPLPLSNLTSQFSVSIAFPLIQRKRNPAVLPFQLLCLGKVMLSCNESAHSHPAARAELGASVMAQTCPEVTPCWSPLHQMSSEVPQSYGFPTEGILCLLRGGLQLLGLSCLIDDNYFTLLSRCPLIGSNDCLTCPRAVLLTEIGFIVPVAL